MTAAAQGLRRWLAVAALFLVTAAVTAALLGGRGGSRGSTISRGPGGWLAARRYLQARGAQVTLISEPLARYVQEQSVESGEPGGPAEPGGSLGLRDRNARGEPGPPIDPLPPRRQAGPGVGSGSVSLGVPLGEGPSSFTPAVSAPRPKGLRGD